MIYCSTKFKIYDNEERLKDFKNMLMSWIKNSTNNQNYLGEIVLGPQAGLPPLCTCNIKDVSLNREVLIIETLTSHMSYSYAWKAIINEFLPNAKIYYYEFCEGNYSSDDPKMRDRYAIQIFACPYNVKNNLSATKNETKEFLQIILQTKEDNFEKLFESFEKIEPTDDLDVMITKWDCYASKEYIPFGDICEITKPNGVIDCSALGYFDDLEYECMELVKKYADKFGLQIHSTNDDEIPISFDIAKRVQETIFDIFDEYGIKLNTFSEA